MNDKQYKKWLNFSIIICDDDKDIAKDILHEFIEKTLKKNNILNNNTILNKDNYVFMCLRNTYFDYKKKNNKIVIENISNINELENIDDYSLESLEDINDDDDKKQLKLNIISETIMTLQSYEKKLYYLHFIVGKSQREIARNIGVSIRVVNWRINKIKDKIKINYEQRK